jgi:hypothetical protein
MNPSYLSTKPYIMKKIVFLSFLMWLSGQAVIAQQPKTGTIGSIGDCPIGMCPTVYFEIEIFNFHKPRTNCTSGFGLCVRFNAGVECSPCFGKSSLTGTKVKVWAKLSNHSATLHIPKSLQTQKGFETVKFSQFELEDQALSFSFPNGAKRSVRGGTYSVTAVGDEWVIQIPFL